MDEYKGLTDKELISRLKKYDIPHGPVVGSTRKLYEKKVYEYETERTQHPSSGGMGSYTEPTNSEIYVRETFASPLNREHLSYGREGLSSTRTYLRENYDSPRNEESYAEYESKDTSPSKSYFSSKYSLPHHEGRSTYSTEDWDDNSSEPSVSSYHHYESLKSSGAGTVSARQPIAEPYSYSFSQNDVSLERDSSSYQNIFHRKSPGFSSLGVEPRRAIHPERQSQAVEKASKNGGGAKRCLPLWPQLFFFVLLAGFLAFIYFFLQGGTDDNPFVKYLKN